MQRYNKKFITTVLTLSLCNAWCRPFIESNMFIPGFNIVKSYNRPDISIRNKDGRVYTIWITNLPIDNKRTFTYVYSLDDLMKMNNPNICEFTYILGERILYIKKKAYIPYDYKGKMMVPCSFITVYNGNNFELISNVTPRKNMHPSGFIIKNK